jgi:hypothetical protein
MDCLLHPVSFGGCGGLLGFKAVYEYHLFERKYHPQEYLEEEMTTKD